MDLIIPQRTRVYLITPPEIARSDLLLPKHLRHTALPEPDLKKRVELHLKEKTFELAAGQSTVQLKKRVEKAERRWRESQAERTIYRINIRKTDLDAASRASGGSTTPRFAKILEAAADPEKRHLSKFLRIKSDGMPLQILDRNGVCLAYKFQMSTEAVDILEQADTYIPDINPIKLRNGERGHHFHAHFGPWGDYDNSLFNSKEMEHFYDKGGKEWAATASPALLELANKARMVDPQTYARAMRPDFTYNKNRKLGHELQGKLTRMAHMWPGVALNREQGNDGQVHQDWADDHGVFNGVIPYGKEFVTGFLVLWQLGIMVEIKRGETILFYGSVIAHNVVEIEGTRNCVDCFYHKSVFDWWERIKRAGKRKAGEVVAAGDDYRMRDQDTETAIAFRKLSNKRLKEVHPKLSNFKDVQDKTKELFETQLLAQKEHERVAKEKLHCERGKEKKVADQKRKEEREIREAVKEVERLNRR